MDLRLRKRIINRYDDGKGVLDGTGLSSKVQFTNPSRIDIDQIRNFHPDLKKSMYTPQKQKTDYSGAIGSGIQGAISIYNNYNMLRLSVKDVGDLTAAAGTSNNNVMGVGYTQLNDIDGAQAMKEVNSTGLSGTLNSTASGAMAGASIAGPWGAVAGGAIGLVSGLFGWGSSKRKQRLRIWNAQLLASRTNQMNRSVAATEGLQQQYYQNNGNTTYGLLYANRGKDLKRPKYEY